MEDALAVFGVATAPVTALVAETADACPAAPALPNWASASLREFRLDSRVTLIRDGGCA
jgi:hypothetical protein